MEQARREMTAPPEGELTTEIHIDVNSIPAHVRDDLAAAMLESFLDYLKQPGNREKLEARVEAKRAAQAARRKEAP